MRTLKVGLALGGGGARGLAHVGVLKVLEREKIPLDVIAGTSSGSLVGALYALNPSAAWVEERLRLGLESEPVAQIRLESLHQQDEELEQGAAGRHAPVKWLGQRLFSLARRIMFLQKVSSRFGLVEPERAQEIVDLLVPDKRVEETKIPFGAMVVDLVSGQELLLTRGPLRTVVSASMARVGVIPPVEWEGYLLVDGGVTQLVPVRAARRLGADVVIAVDVKSRMRSVPKFASGVEVLHRVSNITSNVLNDQLLSEADSVISPRVKSVHWADFRKVDYCIKQGELAAEQALSAVRQLLKRRQVVTFLSRLWG